MKRLLTLLTLLTALAAVTAAAAQSAATGYPLTPVPFTDVQLDADSFWGERLRASREVTVPLAFSKCEESGRYLNFERAAHPSESYEIGGFPFDDTDVYKTIEGASYLLQTYPDEQLKHYIDSVLVVVARAQEPDGYLYTARTMNPAHPHAWSGSERWSEVEGGSHEFYNLGHMVEGAVAHWRATGQRNFLDIAIRYADCVCREIGPGADQLVAVPGHQIAEMALVKLYLATGEQKYLDQARFFLDRRGYTSRKDAYSQAHKPVVEQDEAVGHAVRAVYMYAGMADVAALTGDRSYLEAIDRIWENIVQKKLYLTGGIGATAHGEAFGANYELPNETAYCETCAAIGNVYVNHRMFLLHGESKYYDVLERSLYNGLISGVSMEGGRFFYPNPLASHGQHEREPWFGCACCPSNISRFIPSLPGYVYAVRDDQLYVNLYTSGTVRAKVGGRSVALRQQTDYPWEGRIELTIEQAPSKPFALKLRIPGWVRNEPVPGDLYRYIDGRQPGYRVEVNGQPVDAESLDAGYFTLERRWRKGDRVTLTLELLPRTVVAHEAVAADRGRIAFECGPIVYCAEGIDNPQGVHNLLLNPANGAERGEDLPALGGVRTLRTTAQSLGYAADGQLTAQPVTLTLVPYYAWNHRGRGDMAVWLAAELPAVELARTGVDAQAPETNEFLDK